MQKKKNNVKLNKKKGTIPKKHLKEKKQINPKLLILITFLTGVFLIISSYAWFSASLNVKIKFFDLVVSSDTGLFISLDGIEFTESIEISVDSLIKDLNKTYPNHTNQWATGGLWSVSTNGIKNTNSDKFDVYMGEVGRNRQKKEIKKLLNTTLISESNYSESNAFIAFDIFLKNVSGSPKSDNLYFDDDTLIDFDEATEEEIMDSMSNIMNSMRFGIVKIGSVSSKSDVNTIQNIKCNNSCEMIIYEPNSISHTEASIEKASEHGITLVDGIYSPTYAVISEGTRLEHSNGHIGTGIPLDTEHFRLQKTVTSFDNPIFQIPNGITKLRVYVWIEGQDLDSLETHSKGAAISLMINFVKDLAGYE